MTCTYWLQKHDLLIIMDLILPINLMIPLRGTTLRLSPT